MFTKNHIHYDTLGSTNECALSLKDMPFFSEGLVISTDYQSKGKGQLGKNWYSDKSLNLLLSIVIEPNISLKKQFDISKFVALSFYDFLILLGLSPQIKWPNDILINKKKIAGILIENIVSRGIISHSVIGIGFNINQDKFNSLLPSATSLALELDSKQDCIRIRDKFLDSLTSRIIAYRKGDDIDLDYNHALFLKDEIITLEKEGVRFKGLLLGVDECGLLKIQVHQSLKYFTAKEVKIIV